MKRRYRVASLLTIAEYRARERRARLARRLAIAALIIGALGVILTPCAPLAGFSC